MNKYGAAISAEKTYKLTPVLSFADNHNWALKREKVSSGFANNTGADQPAHPRRLISAFVILVLESIISKLATSEISIF